MGNSRDSSAAETRYLEAAELFMQASKRCVASSSQHQSLAATVATILDRIAQLRGKVQPESVSPPLQQGTATTSDEDFFLTEFETLMPIIDPTRPLVNKGSGQKSAALSNSHTTTPMSHTTSMSHSNTSNGSIRPHSGSGGGEGDLTSTEIAILRRSSFINGRCFLPWLDDELTEKFTYPSGQRFTDPDGFLPLSTSQISKQARYKRIHEIVAASSSTSSGTPGGRPPRPVLIKTVSPLAITQVRFYRVVTARLGFAKKAVCQWIYIFAAYMRIYSVSQVSYHNVA